LILTPDQISAHVDAAFDIGSTNLRHLKCPALQTARYETLIHAESENSTIQYFFPLNLRQNLPILPTLLSSIIEAIRFLGPKNCILSIIEGNSPDGTAEVLSALRPRLEELGVTYYLGTTALDPSSSERIEKLAVLRNAALQPLYDNPELFSEDAIIVFLNDVVACTEDILELTLQLQQLDADMTCAMDWNDGKIPWFYDSWIARGIKGDLFFEWSTELGHKRDKDLFWNEPDTRKRFDAHLPFQVFSCWNGGVTFRARPLLEGLRFRGPDLEAGECVQGEPQVFCKDLWFRGYGKIAVVPSVNFGYTNVTGPRIKKKLGFASDWTSEHSAEDESIQWIGPPDQVQCVDPWSKIYWQPWNETLV
jgi:alpha-1,3-mannosyltransferase